MAKFKIDFLAFNDFYGNTPTYLPSTLVDFDSQEQKAGVGITHTDQVSYVLAAEKKFRKLKDASQYLAVPPNTIVGRNFSYCYNEKFTKSQNASKTLSFSMDAVRRQGNELFLNPFVQILKVGDLLLLTDKYGNEYLFNVTGVSISFRQNNKVYDYSCQDAFSFQLARQNKDYSITNDSSSTSFIGSKTLDYWANKIDKECHIPYQFIPFACGLYENALGQVFKFDTLPIPGRGKDDKPRAMSFIPRLSNRSMTAPLILNILRLLLFPFPGRRQNRLWYLLGTNSIGSCTPMNTFSITSRKFVSTGISGFCPKKTGTGRPVLNSRRTITLRTSRCLLRAAN